ncbi:YdcF family protein [Rhodobacteraceae bacterium NNCM2]|nr:YdcF family protein [Coraliihabitans acroporae]
MLILRIALVILGGLLLVQVLTMIAVMVSSSTMRSAHLNGRSIETPVDAAIVLAGGTDPDGVLSFSTRRRVATAAALVADGKAGMLIMSGGYGARNRHASQGEKMRRIAIDLGVPAEKILIEPYAISTFQNLLLSFPIAESQGASRLAIVTDAYHLRRSAALAAFFGHPDIALVAAPGLEYDHWSKRLLSISREAMAWWFNLLKAAGWEGLSLLGYSHEERTARIR